MENAANMVNIGSDNGNKKGEPMNKKKLAIIIVCALLAVAVIAAAIIIPLLKRDGGGILSIIDDPENEVNSNYNSFLKYEGDPSMKIDGVLDEANWQGKKYYRQTFVGNHDDVMPILQVTAFPTNYGIYIGSIVKDSNIVNDGQRSRTSNSTWRFRIGSFNANEKIVNDEINIFQFYIDMRGDSNSKYGGIDRAVVVNGEINSGATESAVLEMFVPWEVLGIDKGKGIPKQVYIYPSYLAFLPGEEYTTEMLSIQQVRQITDYPHFDENGYTMADRDGAVIGDGKFGYAKTSNWDVSREAQGIVQSSSGLEYHQIYFSQEFGDNFIVETTMIPIGDLENKNPKSGIMFRTLTGNYHTIFLDFEGKDGLVPGAKGTKNFPSYTLVTLNNSTGGWNQHTLTGYDTTRKVKASSAVGTKLTVIKSGDRFWYLVDGYYLYSEQLTFMDGDVMPGFYSLGANVIYRDYSCRTVTDDEITSYLNKKGVYRIDASVDGGGGTISTSIIASTKGGSYEIDIATQPGYQVSKLTINGANRLADAMKNANAGVYKVSNINGNQKIIVAFSQVTGTSLNGTVTNGKDGLSSTVKLTGISNKLLRYEMESDGQGNFTLDVPNGTYRAEISSLGYKTFVGNVTVKGNTKQTFKLAPSDFSQTVKASKGTVTSPVNRWNTTEEYASKVSTSKAMGGHASPLYFRNTASDFVVQTTINYTTQFKPNIKYQPDLIAGFMFNDGKNSAWICANRTGVEYSGWKFISNLSGSSRLLYPNPQSVTFAVAKKGSQLYLYIDGVQVYTMPWSQLAPKMNAKDQFAIGLYFYADWTADGEYTNYSLATGTAAVDKFITDHKPTNKAIAANKKFAETIILNGKALYSSLKAWNLDEIKNNVVKGSYAMGSKMVPLYFSEHGKTALLSAKIEYTTEFKDGVEYQPDLMGGFMLNNGTNTGWIMACSKGLATTGWAYDQTILKENILHTPDKRPVTFTIAVDNGYVYAFFDGKLGKRMSLSSIVKNAKAGDDMAYALYMVADKPADIRFSEITISTSQAAVSDYLNTHVQVATIPDIPKDAPINDADRAYAKKLGAGSKLDTSGNTYDTATLNSGTTVFIGDSFFDHKQNFWDGFYTKYFPNKNVFLAGIGGTRVTDQWKYLVDTVLAGFGYNSPKNIVVNLGTNDIGAGRTPELTAQRLQDLFKQLHEKFPKSKIYYFSIVHRWDGDYTTRNSKIDAVNATMSEWCKTQSYVTYVNTVDKIQQKDLTPDNLHPLPESYKIFVDALTAAGCVIENK